MRNQGLEALAAIATASSSSGHTFSTNTNQDTNSAQQNSNNLNENRAFLGTKEAIGNAGCTSGVQNTSTSTTAAQAHPGEEVGSAVQQWISTGANQTTLGNTNLAFLTGLQQSDPSILLAMQNLAYYQLLMQSQGQNQQLYFQNGIPNPKLGMPATKHQAAMEVLGGIHCQSNPNLIDIQDSKAPDIKKQVLPKALTVNGPHITDYLSNISYAGSETSATMFPPTSSNVSKAGDALPLQPQVLAPQASDASFHTKESSLPVYASSQKEKKQQKRAANRRSAQLSRKRKKQFVEELKEENDDLRRKEQILKSIPDLIVVFDSSGKLLFVSQSASQFLSFSSGELLGTSFWDRICDDSMRLLKAAFMDSLAARQLDSETAPLGSGVWEVRLVDKDGSDSIVTLNGVVHFAGDRPECVCSMRPREKQSSEKNGKANSNCNADLANDSFPSKNSPHQSLLRVKPQQSVVSNDSSHGTRRKVKLAAYSNVGKGREAVRISDSCNSLSGSSESGSSDGLNGTA
ncbi:predicted protein [Phaeodactylum tricornutum CCAP 1055/1]|uniref:PAS domain-containing protein n=2 Tax=Phaeodactylum tricornutum TaxID=2850 RepID=B7G8E7_PHATC|nr:predicted protein [Phaeodactylum tricornutum CCAP 1055/1]EEC45033.1 predicted protein [Phaeodactylum tricornutum CCAP 1055/1]|eukprot:XP_002183333.1 predicted protein [Phaeodactylum tricornutum CCAP 1055/1]